MNRYLIEITDNKSGEIISQVRTCHTPEQALIAMLMDIIPVHRIYGNFEEFSVSIKRLDDKPLYTTISSD